MPTRGSQFTDKDLNPEVFTQSENKSSDEYIDWLISGAPKKTRVQRLSLSDFRAILSSSCSVRNTVYRIEKDGKGPYGDYQNWRRQHHNPGSGRPTPNSDYGYEVAFINIESCGFSRRCWFDSFKRRVEESGGEVKFGFNSLEQLFK